jgi:1,4-alpha-glucan branching enzyme
MFAEAEHEFSHYSPCAGSVDLSADFLAHPVPMRCGPDGWWRIRVPVPGDGCRYFFLVDGVYSTPDYASGEPEYAQDGTLVSILQGHAPSGVGAANSGAHRIRPGS